MNFTITLNTGALHFIIQNDLNRHIILSLPLLTICLNYHWEGSGIGVVG